MYNAAQVCIADALLLKGIRSRREVAVASKLVLRLTAPLVAVSLLLLAVGAGAAWHVHRMQRTVSKDMLDNVSAMRAAEELEILVWHLRTQLDHFLITGERKYLEAGSAFRQEADRWLTQAERYSLTPYEEQLTTRARRGYRLFLKELGRLAGQDS